MMSIDMDILKREYLFASTAAQIYKHFRENSSVRNLAKEKPETLIKEYKKRTEKGKRRIEGVVVAYAIIIAITFYDYQEALNIFKKFDLSKLEWGEKLKDIYTREVQITSYVTKQGSGIELKDIYTRSSDVMSYMYEQGKGIAGDSKQIRAEASSTGSDKSMLNNK